MSYEYLAHHGILGQKWGVRRFQNKDGSYTAAGKKRHANNDSTDESSINSKTASKAEPTSKQVDKKINTYQSRKYREELELKDWKKLYKEYEKEGTLDEDTAALLNKYMNTNITNIKKYDEKIDSYIKEVSSKYAITFNKDSGFYSVKENLKSSAGKPDNNESRKKAEKTTHNSSKEASSKATPGFAKYIQKETGGFDKIDDPEILELVAMEYEELTGRKAYK